MDRPNCRQVLECASPLALFARLRDQKWQRAAAVQDATAPMQLPYDSWLPKGLNFLGGKVKINCSKVKR